ncbi:hypothetical protein SISNIDRAFT_468264 [Sistotremastrum niveocremeum HHB9708]|uniref:F-box domain-containing protein n=1 Tax=Sistotremastrum niveocremeum HHB9708 TaxID=1314777 RepID=A0A164RPK6_9AGAM|nr:hypothetical protein SISNIDRAFT_468264 [Sistotremastrum niveocremeum HHB9708]
MEVQYSSSHAVAQNSGSGDVADFANALIQEVDETERSRALIQSNGNAPLDDEAKQTLASLRDVQQRVNKSITDASASISRSLNSRTPLGRLPVELLSKIALHYTEGARKGVVDIHEEWNERETASLPLKKIIIISHIFSRWRQVCLDSACLWSHIDLAWNLAAVYAFATRSKSSLLCIRFNSSAQDSLFASDETTEVAARICPHIQFLTAEIFRIESLSIVIDSFGFPVTELWYGIDTLRAPELKRFILVQNTSDRRLLSSRNLFSDHFPKLRMLRLDGFSCKRLTSPLLACLRSLYLSVGLTESTTDAISAISNAPLLEDLTLENIRFNDIVRHLQSGGKPVKLEHCRNLALKKLNADSVIRLFAAFEFPVIRAINISSRPLVAPDGTMISIYSSLPESVKALAAGASDLQIEMHSGMVSLAVPFTPGVFSPIQLVERVNHLHRKQRDEVRHLLLHCAFDFFVIRPEVLQVWGSDPTPEFDENDEPVRTGMDNENNIFTQQLWQALLSNSSSVVEMSLWGTEPLDPFIEELERTDVCPALKELRISIEDEELYTERFQAMLDLRKERNAEIEEACLSELEL